MARKKNTKLSTGPVQVRALSFPEMLEEVKRRREEAKKYVDATGKCFVCKKNPPRLNDLQCQDCIDKVYKLVAPLLSSKGFVAI